MNSETAFFVFGLIALGIALQKIIVFFILELRFKRVPEISSDELPHVAILIPARNEADNLPRCLESLLCLDYPYEHIEIWVGNDQSTDATGEIANDYAQQYECIQVLDIQPEYYGLTARSNVLAQLAKKAGHDLLVFLDADMEVSPGWLTDMVMPTTQGFDLVSGYTEVEGKGLLAQFQKSDWRNVITFLKAGADIGLPGTALGNNMLVTRKAYEAVGGYERIGPTFTEDNDLTLAAVKKGFKLFQLLVPEGASTQPMKSWRELKKQRNRWMQGAFRQPLLRLIPFMIARVFVLIGLIAAFFDPTIAIMLVGFVSMVDIILSLAVSSFLKKYHPFYIALFAPVFNSILDTFTLLSYPWNKQVVWKGRKL